MTASDYRVKMFEAFAMIDKGDRLAGCQHALDAFDGLRESLTNELGDVERERDELRASSPSRDSGALHAAASDLRHVASGGSCAPETLLAHADALEREVAHMRAYIDECDRALLRQTGRIARDKTARSTLERDAARMRATIVEAEDALRVAVKNLPASDARGVVQVVRNTIRAALRAPTTETSNNG